MESTEESVLLPAQSTLIAVATSIVLIAAVVYAWWNHPDYGKNKGPKIYPLVGCLPLVMRNRHRLYDWATEELQKVPSHTMRVVMPAGNVLIGTANPANVEHILRSRFEQYPKGQLLQDNFFDLLGRGIFNADGDLWKFQRKVASHEFTTRSLRELVVQSVNGELQSRLVPILAKISDEGSTIDLQDLLLRFAFDNICQISFGVDPACLDSSLPIVPFAQAFDDATEYSTQRFTGFGLLTWKLKKAFDIGSERKLRKAIAVVNEYAKVLVGTRRKQLQEATGGQSSGEHLDMLSRFMRFADSASGDIPGRTELEQKVIQDLRHKGNDDGAFNSKEEMSDEFLRDVVISFVLAGRDTTSSALAWFFWLLTSNPRVEAAIYGEIEGHLRARDSKEEEDSSSLYTQNASFTFEELKDLHYLHAALSESLRLYPPVPVDSKAALQDDVLPDGTFVAKNQRVSYNVFAMGRMENLWGPDCLKFKPERWLNDGVFTPESPYKYPVFQAGPRICLGKDMAMIQMKLIVAALIHNFTFSLASSDSPQYNLSVTMRIKHGLHVIPHHRIPLQILKS